MRAAHSRIALFSSRLLAVRPPPDADCRRPVPEPPRPVLQQQPGRAPLDGSRSKVDEHDEQKCQRDDRSRRRLKQPPHGQLKHVKADVLAQQGINYTKRLTVYESSDRFPPLGDTFRRQQAEHDAHRD